MVQPKQTFDLVFSNGIDQSIDSNIVDGDILSKLENGVITKQGAISKRNGYTAITKTIRSGSITTSLSSGSSLFTFDGKELLASDGRYAYSYITGSSNTSPYFVNSGKVVSVDIEAQQIKTPFRDQTLINAISVDGLTYTFSKNNWNPTGGRQGFMTITDNISGKVLSSILITGSNPSHFVASAFPDGIVVEYNSGEGTSGYHGWEEYYTLSGSFPKAILGTFSNVEHPVKDSYALDLSSALGVGTVLNSHVSHIEASLTTRGDRLNPPTYDPGVVPNWDIYSPLTGSFSGIGTSVFDVSSSVNGQFLSTTGSVYIALLTTSGSLTISKANVFASVRTISNVSKTNSISGTLLWGPITIGTHVSGTRVGLYNDTQAGVVTAYYGSDGSVSGSWYRQIKKAAISGSGTAIVSGSVIVNGCELHTKPFAHNGIQYFNGFYRDDLQNTYFLFDESGSVISRYFVGEANVDRDEYYLPPVSSIASNVYRWPAARQLRIASNVDLFSDTSLYSIKATFKIDAIQPTKYGNAIYFTNGICNSYDQELTYNIGFNVFPNRLSSSLQAGGGTGQADGDYLYTATYEWRNAKNELRRSAIATSLNATQASAGVSSLNIHVPHYRFNESGDTTIKIYRTEVNPGADPVYYLLASIVNYPTGSQHIYRDTSADSSIIGNEILYTVGGELENIAPPSCSTLCKVKDRLILAGSEDKKKFWVSKPLISNEVAAFSDALVYTAPEDITALSELDGKLVIFSKEKIYYLDGEFADAAGLNESLSEITPISSFVGCNNEKSVVATNIGIVFQSTSGGLYLLSRDLSVTYFGGKVEDELRNTTILSISNVESSQEIRFVLSSNRTLVYNYAKQIWSVFTGLAAVDSTMWNDKYAWIDNAGQVYVETSGTFTDNGSTYALKVDTGWLKFGSIKNYKRLHSLDLLGKYIGQHILTASLSYDYEENVAESHYFDTSTTIAETGSSGIVENKYSYRIKPPKYPKSTAVKVSLSDLSNSGSSYSLNSISFDYSGGVIKKESENKSR